mgnify:CR=1 FL=1
MKMKTLIATALAASLTLGLATATLAESAPVAASAEEAYKDIEATFGFVPEFLKLYPKASVSGAWYAMKNFELADTALDAKTKALISVAVASQIPCQYCIWLDSKTATDLGATDEQVREAVTMAAMTRHWSAVLNGYQIDMDAFKKEFSGE